MKTGNMPENVLKRSVLKRIKPDDEIVLRGAAVGADCAFLRINPQDICAMAHGSAIMEKEDSMAHAIYRATNNLAAGGAKPMAIQVGLMMPKACVEHQLKMIMSQAQKTAEELGVTIAGGNTQIHPAIKEPVVNITALGIPYKENVWKKPKIRIGQDIVMSKWIGISATAYLAKQYEKDLCTRYPVNYIKDAQSLEQYYSIIPEAATAIRSGVSAMHDVSGCGIFGALWELGEYAGVGLTISLKKIPVKQETIEICEFFDLNPYKMRSDGALLMVTEDGLALVEALEKEGIPAAVIGTITAGNDKVVVNDEEKRFLEPPYSDEWYKVI